MTIKYKGYGSYLKVKLSFKKSVSPSMYYSVKKRLELPRETFSGYVIYTDLSEYLRKFDGLEISVNGFRDELMKGRKVSIKSNKRKMTLEISVESEKFLKNNELLNVLDLHEFIKMGKYPQKHSGPQP